MDTGVFFVGLFRRALILASNISDKDSRGLWTCVCAFFKPTFPCFVSLSFLCFSIIPEITDQTVLTMMMIVMIFVICAAYQLCPRVNNYGQIRCRLPASSVAQARSTPKTSPNEPGDRTAELFPARTNSPFRRTKAVSAM